MFCTWSYLAILESIIRSLQIPILPSSLSFWKIQQYYIPEHSRPKLENIVQLTHICISNYTRYLSTYYIVQKLKLGLFGIFSSFHRWHLWSQKKVKLHFFGYYSTVQILRRRRRRKIRQISIGWQSTIIIIIIELSVPYNSMFNMQTGQFSESFWGENGGSLSHWHE